jgi:hypothetical protein
VRQVIAAVGSGAATAISGATVAGAAMRIEDAVLISHALCSFASTFAVKVSTTTHSASASFLFFLMKCRAPRLANSQEIDYLCGVDATAEQLGVIEVILAFTVHPLRALCNITSDVWLGISDIPMSERCEFPLSARHRGLTAWSSAARLGLPHSTANS